MAISIQVNGKDMTITHRLSISGLIELLEIDNESGIAVELNREIIPRSQYKQHFIDVDDQVEIVRAVGGG